MEHVLELLYEGAVVWIFCMAAALMFHCFGCMDRQTEYVKENIYEQHTLYGSLLE